MKLSTSIFLIAFSLLNFLGTSNIQAKELPCPIEITNDSLQFGTVYTGDVALRSVSITNRSNQTITIDTAFIYSRWSVFTCSLPKPIQVEPNQTKDITISFKSPHNLTHVGHVLFRISCPVMTYSTAVYMQAKAQYAESEFAFTQNLEGQELFTALNKYLNESLMFSYSDARQFMFSKADNVNGTVECIYSGRTIQTTGIPNINIFNTEHSWPQSKGADQEPARSDVYIIYPADSKANERRSNHPYGVVSRGISWESGGSKLGLPQASADTVFEPRNAVKGNIARSMLYFATRYGNRKGTFDQSGFLTNMESIIRAWNKQDPVDERERNRAISIASAQKRMNPYIAYPEMIDRIFKLSTQPAFPLYPEPVTDPIGVYASIISDDSIIVRIPIINEGNQALRITSTEFRPAISTARVLSIDSNVAPASMTYATILMKSPIQKSTLLRIRFADGIPTLAIPISTEAVVSAISQVNESDYFSAYPNPALPSEVQTIVFSSSNIKNARFGMYDLKGFLLKDLTEEVIWTDQRGELKIFHDSPGQLRVLRIQSNHHNSSTLLHTGF